MSLKVILVMIVVAVIFRDIIAMIPAVIVWLISRIGSMNTRTFAVAVLVVAGVLYLIKKIK